MEPKAVTERRGNLLAKVGGRRAPRTYIVQTYNFDLIAYRGKEKPYPLRVVGKNRVLRVLAGPLPYNTKEEQIRAMEIATENKNRWPMEVLSVEPTFSLGVICEVEKPSVYAAPCDDAEAW